MTKVLPLVMAILSILAAGVYVYNKQYAHALYWVFAASLTITTLFM